MSDTKILESRLLTRESAIGGSSLSRCALRLQQFLLRCGTEEGFATSASSIEYEAFCREILLYQVEMKKYDEIHAMFDEEIQDYQLLEQAIQKKILETQSSIDHLTTELIQQRSLRRHREECENLAKIVNSVPSRDISQKKITHLEEEIAKLNDQIAAQEAREKLRLRQFRLISQAIADMSRSLDEESEAQNELLLLQQQLQSSADGPAEGEDDENENDDNDGDEGGGSRDKRTEKTEHMDHVAKKPRIEEVEEEEGEEGQGGEEESEVGKEKDKQDKGDDAYRNSPEPPPPSASNSVNVSDNGGRISPRATVPTSSTSATSSSSPRSMASTSMNSPRGLRQQALASKKVHEPEEGEEEEHKGGEESNTGESRGGGEKHESDNGMEIVS